MNTDTTDTMDNSAYSNYGNSTSNLTPTPTEKPQPINDIPNSNQESPVKSRTQTRSSPWYRREDVLLLGAGVVFILVVLGMIAAVGQARGWDAGSGFDHNETETSQERLVWSNN